MKPSVFLVISSFCFGALGFLVALAANYFSNGAGPVDRPMILLTGLTAIGVVSGFFIAWLGLKMDRQQANATDSSAHLAQH